MYNKFAAMLLSVLTVVTACTTSDRVQTRIHEDFEARKAAIQQPDLYNVFGTDMTDEERKAMEFLYAYMPLPDMTDYSGDFYLDNVKTTLTAKAEMPWGETVPEREFRHFVLPVRVNNENLDNSRMVFYDELKDRVKGLSMYDAILEINHWCHEKVTYRPSDSRTSSPLASVRTAYGRCGEESTFTVAALRAMGIPARQVYTPRWAHTDDNHAWVEAWADGKWYFLGACEPEPVLNLGWFNAPASRGMMMNTKVMGAYDGPEEQLGTNACYTEINVTSNYAPVSTTEVVVVDTDNKPVADAKVEFKLYNYGEFYTIATKKTDAAGKATLTSGLGDMLVWASAGDRFGFVTVSAIKDGATATVMLDKDMTSAGEWEWDMVPPAPSANIPELDAEQVRVNDERKVREDSIRNAYTSTFMTEESGREFARSIGAGSSADKIAALLVASRGNHAVIADFLRRHIADAPAVELLEVISDKDLRDIPAEVLEDHVATAKVATPLYAEYILNPRVTNEMLTPYKAYFSQAIPADMQAAFVADPRKWVEWCADSIVIDSKWNPQNLRMTPKSVYAGRVTDAGSRDIFFVAAARSMGIPARIDPVTEKPQYADSKGNWNDADFAAAANTENAPQGQLRIAYTPAGRMTDPQYYYHFTLSKVADGAPSLLNYPDDAALSSTFRGATDLDAGQYLMVSGQRMADGTVLAKASLFPVAVGRIADQELVMRQDTVGVQVIGGFNSENLYHNLADNTDRSLLSTTGRGYYVLGLITPNHEPTTHALNDISLYKEDLEKWGGSIVLLFNDESAASRFNASQFPGLPSTVVFGTDINGNIFKEIAENMKLTSSERPVFIVADTFNRIVYITQGYNIGLGEKLTDVLHKVGR